MLSTRDIIEAESRIRSLARETPVDRSLHLSRLGDADVYLKLEHLQHTGSFKLRGATNKILSLDDRQSWDGRLLRGPPRGDDGDDLFAARRLGTETGGDQTPRRNPRLVRRRLPRSGIHSA